MDRVEETRRKLLGGEDGVSREFGELDPRSKEIFLPEPCPKCGASEEFVDPDGQVIKNQPVRGLRCDDCRHFWVPQKPKLPGADQ